MNLFDRWRWSEKSPPVPLGIGLIIRISLLAQFDSSLKIEENFFSLLSLFCGDQYHLLVALAPYGAEAEGPFAR
jgi:hypothetical protein